MLDILTLQASSPNPTLLTVLYTVLVSFLLSSLIGLTYVKTFKGLSFSMGYVQAQLDVPVVADESVQTMADVERLAAAGVQGINLKLMKVGGLAPGLQMLRRARELGLRIMLGCMVETSLVRVE